ncbi:hypothetical protein P8452_47632 [Trifolium repens]|nr:hypothetical protein P8452_47632 [Trifolium repens]
MFPFRWLCELSPAAGSVPILVLRLWKWSLCGVVIVISDVERDPKRYHQICSFCDESIIIGDDELIFHTQKI